MSTDKFYDEVRGSLFSGRLSQSQVDGMEAILEVTKHLPISYRAYMLATVYHETAKTMKPIKEYGGNAYFHRMYDIKGSRPHVARRLGNTRPGDGIRFAGRGYVQLTGRDNYRKASRKLGVDLVKNPDRAMEPIIASKIMYHGMSEGWFTGKKMSDYLPGDYRNARRIINGTDKAITIARYARLFEVALSKSESIEQQTTWWDRFKDLL